MWNLLLEYVSTLEHLTELSLENCTGDYGSYSSIEKLCKLTSLTMSKSSCEVENCRLTDKAVSLISKLSKLQKLNICMVWIQSELNYAVSDDMLKTLISKLKSLRQLEFPIFGPGYGSFRTWVVNVASLELNSLKAKLIAKNMTGITNLNIGAVWLTQVATGSVLRVPGTL